MEFRFNAEEWVTLSKEQRIRRCRLMAEQSRKLAEQSTGTTKVAYLTLEKDWEMLAFEMEHN